MARPRLKGGLVGLVAALALLTFTASAHAYIYWTTEDANHPERLGRVNNNGTHKDPKFILDAKSTPDAVTTDRRHIYWISGLDSIGRARINGSKVDPKFIDREFIYVPRGDPYVESLHNPFGLAVNENYIYWTDRGTKSIGRAATDGSDINVEFIPDVGKYVSSLALDDKYLYWPGSDDSLMRSSLDGSGVKAIVKNVPNAVTIFVDRLGP